MPAAVVLSVRIGVAGCGWPSSSRVIRIELASLQLQNKAANSASAALETTVRRIVHTTCTGALNLGAGDFSSGGSLDWKLR